MDIQQLYKVYLKHPCVETDTRKLKKGNLFFALRGPNFNGNSFAQQAINQGAAFAVIDEIKYEIPGRTILVADVLTTLQKLAHQHRLQFKIPFLAITGSNGKTTTKELIHVVLGTTFKTCTTEGNLNNHIGVPLTILKIKDDTEIAIIEMGANHQQEIAGYCTYALPTHGIITNCGKAHLEGFGGEEGVKKGKGELYDHLKNNRGTAFVMWDHDYLKEMSRGIHTIVKYGTKDADFECQIVKHDPFLEINIIKGADIGKIKTQLVGKYNFSNVMAAVCVGKYFKVEDEKIKSAIENYIPSNSRSQLIIIESNHIILDAYNANPNSMKEAIENFAAMNAANKVVMLGAMAELGDESPAEHRALIELIKKYNWKEVVLVGTDFIKCNPPYLTLENSEQAKEWYRQQEFQNTYILIKGSRSFEMEKVI